MDGMNTNRRSCSENSPLKKTLKVQSCKLYNNKYLIPPIQVKNTEIYAFIAVLVFKLLSRNVCLQTEKTIGTVKK